MSTSEFRNICLLSLVMSLRMLGLFMIIPVFSLYASQYLSNSDPLLIGIAMGIYGLTQALLQIPFGTLSDRYGRKIIITIGLLLFVIGSIICGLSHSIYGIILGRSLQGCGAIGSALLALVADSSREENRSKAMAIIGLTIGISFSAAMFVGPIINSIIGVTGVFWLSGLLAIFAIVVLNHFVQTPAKSVFHRDMQPIPALFASIFKNKDLMRLNLGIFVLHAMLTATFLALPIVLEKNVHVAGSEQWHLFLPVLLIAFMATAALMAVAEKKHLTKTLLLVAIASLIAAQVGFMYLANSSLGAILLLLLFFTPFCWLEATLPALISKIAPAGSKGTAMGVYSTSQFLGIFIGGSVGGLLGKYFNEPALFLFCALSCLLWLLFTLNMKQPPSYTTELINVGTVSPEKATALTNKMLAIPGVAEAVIMVDEGIAYLKIDKNRLNPIQLSSVKEQLGVFV